MPSVRSVALGFWIGTGSAAEDEPEAGLSHLVEHMLFRGHRRATARWRSTSSSTRWAPSSTRAPARRRRRSTRACSTCTSTEAFDVMADMVWRPALRRGGPRQRAPDRARGDRDVRGRPAGQGLRRPRRGVFGDHPLGRAIIGRADVVGGHAAPTARARSTRALRAAQNVVVAAAGSIDHDALVELARAADAAARPSSTAPLAAAAARRPRGARCASSRKDTEQYHVCLGAPGIARDDERRFALRVLDNVLGGTSSSRLFQEVRERRGPGLHRLLVPARCTPAPGRSASTSARGPTTSARRCRSSPTSSSASAPTPPPPRSSRAPRRTSRAASCWRWSRRRRG